MYILKGLVIRWVTNLVGLLVAAYLLEGIDYDSTSALAVASLVLSVVNVTIKPLLAVLSLPVQVLTLGLFTFVLNGLMLMIVSALVGGFHVYGLLAAIVGSIIVSIVGGLFYHVIDTADR